MIESWFGQFKKRCVGCSERETLKHARTDIAGYVNVQHLWPHSGLTHLTPAEVAQTQRTINNQRPETSNDTGSTSPSPPEMV